MALANLTSPTAVKLAIRECDSLGREVFVRRYGFGSAREYVLRFEGSEYDSKAVVGVAHGFQFPESGPLEHGMFSGGIGTSAAATKAFELGFDVEGMTRRPIDWTLKECEKAVVAYFECLAAKLNGQSYNRAAACREVAAAIGRSEGAVDYKFQNIDAVLAKHDLPRMMNAIAPNVQHLLELVVLDPLAEHTSVFEFSTGQEIVATSSTEFVDPPATTERVRTEDSKDKVPVTIDFASRDARNSKLGRDGENWVVSLERKRMSETGQADLAGQVDWVADRLGDGLGYDIVSFDADGSQVYIEVKTTNGGITTPFLISANELSVSERRGSSFRLYRVFNFATEPRVYVLKGPLSGALRLVPKVYRALPNSRENQ